MAGNVYGVSSYQQTNQAWKKNTSSNNREATEKIGSEVKVSEWKPISDKSPLVPVPRLGVKSELCVAYTTAIATQSEPHLQPTPQLMATRDP